MPRIIVQATLPDGRRSQVTLSERALAENLRDRHYARQLLERLSWATADAEGLEQRPSRGVRPRTTYADTPNRPEMSAHSSQTVSGTTPARISSPKTLQPRQ